MLAEVSPCEEGAHGVPHDADGGVRPSLLGYLRDAVDVVDEEVWAEGTVREMPALVFARLAMAEMVMPDDRPSVGDHVSRKRIIAVDIFFHTMHNLQDCTRLLIGLPCNIVNLLCLIRGGHEMMLLHCCWFLGSGIGYLTFGFILRKVRLLNQTIIHRKNRTTCHYSDKDSVILLFVDSKNEAFL